MICGLPQVKREQQQKTNSDIDVALLVHHCNVLVETEGYVGYGFFVLGLGAWFNSASF